jgi:two-component system NtrC family response regulator
MEVPPLRERPEDIPELVALFLRRSAARFGKGVSQIDDDALALLKGYSWPGNIRQLENVIERAVVIAEAEIVTPAELPSELLNASADPGEAEAFADGFGESPTAVPLPAWRADQQRRQRDQLVRALSAAAGNKAEAARALGIARSTLLSRMKKLGLA